MQRQPYWISPTGRYYVPDRHILMMMARPQLFGVTLEEILALYRRYREHPGSEGRARREMIGRAVCNGWVRLRRHGYSYWSVTAAQCNPHWQATLSRWRAGCCAGASRASGKMIPIIRSASISMT